MQNVEIAAAYVRVSTDDQTELSPDAQTREIMKAAKADGYIIPKEFIFMEKKGISGRKADNRPEFQKMIATAKLNPSPFTRLYLWKFSRFARNQDESTFYKSILRKKCGVEIISVSEPIVQGMFGRLLESIIEWFDEYYSFNLSGEVIRGMTEKALKEGYQTAPSLGYDAVGNGKPFIINEDDYKIVERIFRLFAISKLDRTGIARQLNAEGFRTKRGNLFERRTIDRILRNRFYIGEVKWRGIKFVGPHETRPSVTDYFELCQQRLEQEYRPLKRRSIATCRHWLSGLLKCSICNATMSYNGGGNSRPDAVFACWKYAKGYHKESCSVTVAKAERTMLLSLEEIIRTGNITYEYIPKNNQPEDLAHIALLEELLKKWAVKEDRVRAAYENGIDTIEEYKANRLRLKEEMDDIMRELDAAKSKEVQENKPSKEEVLSRISNVYELLKDPNINFEVKGNALRSIVKYIVFDRENDHFDFHYYV